MTSRRLAGITSSFILIGTIAWWWIRDSSGPTPHSAAPSSAPGVRKQAPPSGLTTAPIEALPEFGTEAFNQLAKERGAAWMASRNRDAVSLLAMWDMTGDEAMLREAAEKFPGNPQVGLAILALVFDSGTGKTEEQRKWTDHLIAADPENPLGEGEMGAMKYLLGAMAKPPP